MIKKGIDVEVMFMTENHDLGQHFMEMESEDINWTLCVICQTQTTDKTRSTYDGLISLSTSLEKFKVINALP